VLVCISFIYGSIFSLDFFHLKKTNITIRAIVEIIHFIDEIHSLKPEYAVHFRDLTRIITSQVPDKFP